MFAVSKRLSEEPESHREENPVGYSPTGPFLMIPIGKRANLRIRRILSAESDGGTLPWS
jgi:hypothetical protein